MAGDDDAQMPDADADADADADTDGAGAGAGGSGGGLLEGAAAAAEEGGAGRALRLPPLTMSVALEECEKALRPLPTPTLP